MVEKGYQPIVKKTKNPPDGFGSKKRDEVFSVREYKHRRGSGVCLQPGLVTECLVF